MTDLSTRTIDRPPPTPANIARSRREAPSKLATVTATELGEHLGLTRQRVSALADTEHVIERLPNGRFDQDDCRLRYLRWLRDPQRRSARSEAASEFSKAKTELIRLRIEQRKRILVSREEANACIDHTVGLFLTKLSGLSARASRDLVVRRAIDGVIFTIRQEIADECLRLADENGEPAEPMEEA